MTLGVRAQNNLMMMETAGFPFIFTGCLGCGLSADTGNIMENVRGSCVVTAVIRLKTLECTTVEKTVVLWEEPNVTPAQAYGLYLDCRGMQHEMYRDAVKYSWTMN